MLVAYDNNHQMVMAMNANKFQDLYCYACNEQVILRIGSFKIPHFAHRRGTECDSFSEGETKEHVLGKQQLYEFFNDNDNDPRLEYYFKSIKQRPDLLLKHRRIIEFQCSPISNQRLSERLSGYEQINHTSVWILGSPYLKLRYSYKKIKQFLRYNHRIGFYIMYWDVKNSQLIIRYRIKMRIDQLVYGTAIINNLAGLKRFFNQPVQPTRIALNVDELVMRLNRATLRLQKRLINQKGRNEIQTFCYQRGFNLAGYPIEMDFPAAGVPILGNRLIEYKLVILLLLIQHQKMDVFMLISQAQRILKLDLSFHMINRTIILRGLQTIFNDLQRQGIINRTYDEIELIRVPKWYSASDERMQNIKKELINKIDQFFK
ncbi:competence protein CoiA [Lactobacillaceae bacterium Melli_B4]